MDAENIALEGYGAILEADSGMLQLEMAQSGMLFGYEDSSFSLSGSGDRLHPCRTFLKIRLA